MKISRGVGRDDPVIFIDVLQILQDVVHLRQDLRRSAIEVKDRLRDCPGQHLSDGQGIYQFSGVFRKRGMGNLIAIAYDNGVGEALPGR